MTKTTRNTAAATEEAFHRHYAAIWGKERWQDSLYPALADATRYAALVNRYTSLDDFWKAIGEADIPRDDLTELHFPKLGGTVANGTNQGVVHGLSNTSGMLCFARSTTEMPLASQSFPPPKTSATQTAKLMTHWNLDAASALAAHLLDIKAGDVVLDLCAAPGGKSVTLSQRLFPSWHGSSADLAPASLAESEAIGRLVSNEADGRRQKRLAENLRDYIPAPLLKAGYVQCTNIDGTSTSTTALVAGKSGYDKVLVDAPCSSERHIIHAHLKARASGAAAPEMANWRPGSSKRLAETQAKLLMTALKAAKAGGSVMYATCSIENVENDGVIEKTMREVAKERKKGTIKWDIQLGFGERETNQAVEAELEAWAERTKYGWIVLPDHPGKGKWGPLFFAMIKKIAV